MTIHLSFDPPEPVVFDAFQIALVYLVKTGQAEDTVEVQHELARAIVCEWNAGKHHRIWLANKAIIAFQRKANQRAPWPDELFPTSRR